MNRNLGDAPEPVAGLVLAAGTSTRFGVKNKVLATVDGEHLIHRIVRTFLQAHLAPVFVVVGHDAHHVADVLRDLPVTIVFNPDYAEGQSTSLRAGVAALPATVTAAVIGVADQPYLTPRTIEDLVDLHRREAAGLVVPRYAGTRGNPVLFGRSYFGELMNVAGDQGGRPVLQRYADRIVWLDRDDASGQLDVDTVEDLAHLDGLGELP